MNRDFENKNEEIYKGENIKEMEEEEEDEKENFKESICHSEIKSERKNEELDNSNNFILSKKNENSRKFSDNNEEENYYDEKFNDSENDKEKDENENEHEQKVEKEELSKLINEKTKELVLKYDPDNKGNEELIFDDKFEDDEFDF